MNKLQIVLIQLLTIALVAASSYSGAANIINIAATGSTAYSITTTDLPETAGIDLSIEYDAEAFGAPIVVNKGALATNAIMESNVSTPSIVRIVLITSGAIKGTGELLSVKFTSKGKVPKKSTKIGLNPSFFSASGNQLKVQSTFDHSLPATKNNSDLPLTAQTGTQAGAQTVTQATTQDIATGTVSIGTISFPVAQQQQRQKVEQKEQENRDIQQPDSTQQSSSAPAAELSKAVPPALMNDFSNNKTGSLPAGLGFIKGALVSFNEYKGPRTLKAFAPLFDENEAKIAGIIQSPAIAVADGKVLVTIALDLPKGAAPNFSFKGANMKSIRRLSETKLELDVMPQKGKSDVRLSIFLKGDSIVIPLNVVPPLNQAVTVKMSSLSVAALDNMLVNNLKNNKPVYDLNSDGKQDYVDDYILVAHWLLKQKRSLSGSGLKPAVSGK